MPIHIVLVEPQIPQNTGNVARTCAAIGAELHLVHPLGFSTGQADVRRAGLDYWELLTIHHHESFDAFLQARCKAELHLFSARAEVDYASRSYGADAYLVFGCESAGLPDSIRSRFPERLVRIPTVGQARSLNLSNAVAVAAYEVMRQHDFPRLQRRRLDP